MEELVADICPKDCSYRRHFHGCTVYCDYIGATGHSRNCKISECDKYTTEKVEYPETFWVTREL
jgi:hypothetical protein